MINTGSVPSAISDNSYADLLPRKLKILEGKARKCCLHGMTPQNRLRGESDERTEKETAPGVQEEL
jgi:hypothetical protein